jgi:hypothetical protein
MSVTPIPAASFAASLGQHGGTTSGVNTTGANLIVVLISSDSANAKTLSDSKGNTWSAKTAYADFPATDNEIRAYVATNPSVGPGHTFTVSGSNIFASIAVLSFSGAHSSGPFDQQAGQGVASGTSAQPGSVTPSEDNELLIAALTFEVSNTISVNSGFTIAGQANLIGGVSYGIAAAYKIQTTAGAENPTFSWANACPSAANILTFKVAVTRTPADYYVASSGSDGNTGLIGQPWQTVAGPNAKRFVGGDTLSFNRGDTFTGSLLLQLLDGALQPDSGSPVVVGPYGTGADPKISSGTAYGIKALNIAYCTIQDFEVFGATVTFTSGSPNTVSYTNTAFGIHFHNTGASNLAGPIVRRCTVHGYQYGVVIGDNVASQTHGFDDWEIFENEVYGCTVVGICCGNFTNYTPTIHNRGIIRRNYIYNIYGDWNGVTGSNTGYPIQIPASTGVLVESNVCKDSGSASEPGGGGGPCGIICVGTHDAIIRGNIILNIDSQAGDGTGIDSDGNDNNDILIEGNYIAGCLRWAVTIFNIGGPSANITVRHNICQDNGGGLDNIGGTNVVVHNNVFHKINADTVWVLRTAAAGTAFYNNILICGPASPAGQLFAGTVMNGNLYDCNLFDLTYNGNNYSSLAAFQSGESQEADGIEAVAGLTNAGNGPTDWTDPNIAASTIDDYDPEIGSVAIGAGLDLLDLYSIDPGTVDFHGLAIASWRQFNIGPVESIESIDKFSLEEPYLIYLK